MQDYHFGREFVRYVGHIMSIAPDDAIGVLLSGMTAMDDELKWFQVRGGCWVGGGWGVFWQ